MRSVLVLLCLIVAGCPQQNGNNPGGDAGAACNQVAGKSPLRLVQVVGGFSRPVAAVVPRGDRRIFVVEQSSGRISIVENGVARATAFLDIGGSISTGGEQGLLGLAFHPNYPVNGRFFINYTDTAGNTQVDEYLVSTSDPNLANPATRRN